MKKIIKLSTFENIKKFCFMADSIHGDVLVSKGKFVVDGSSLMAIMSLDLNDPIMVEFPEDAKEFEEFLTKIEV